ncbi:MAG: hypothetical protein AAGF01_09185 [Cyanobacteria bacterium P01_G01_bin.38]
MNDGTKILTASGGITELLYPSGARRVTNRHNNRTTYYKPDGTEALPGQTIKLREDFVMEVPRRLFLSEMLWRFAYRLGLNREKGEDKNGYIHLD